MSDIDRGRELVLSGKYASHDEPPPDELPPDESASAAAGCDLLDTLRSTLTRYVVFPDQLTADAVTLYVAATHAQPAWEHATRLVIKSPLKRCGKSRLQEVIAETCHRPLRTANCSTAALVRSIDAADPPTVLLDEADTIFRGGKAAKDSVAEDLRGFINSGHSRGTPYLRWDVKARRLDECSTFAMAVLGGIGDMPDTIEDRAVIVCMRRRASGETVTQFRRRSVPSLHRLRDRLAAWVRGNIDALGKAEPTMPVYDRAADTWEPLVAVADLAGGTWPERARAACTAMTGSADDEPDSAGERLLADVRHVFGSRPALLTASVLEHLHSLEESPWSDYYGKPLTDRGLAKLLRPYGVKSRNVRVGDDQGKGYSRDDLADAWRRYVPSVPASQADEIPSSTSENSRDGSGTDTVCEKRPTADQHKSTIWDAGTLGTDVVPKSDHPTPATVQQNAAYRAGRCIDCHTRPHSAGRNRCDECHGLRMAVPRRQRTRGRYRTDEETGMESA